MYQYADLPTFSVAPASNQMVYSAFRTMFGSENAPFDVPDVDEEQQVDPEDDEMDDDLEAEIDPNFPDELPDTSQPSNDPQQPREIQM